MNEQLQQALAAMLSKTVSGVEAGAAFLQAEIPDVIQQLLLWKAVSGLLIFVISAAVAAFCIAKMKPFAVKLVEYNRGSSMYYNNSGDIEREGKRIMGENGGAIPFALAWGLAAIISVMCFLFDGLSSASAALQIWIAPKIYLIEYAASLAK